jgi:uncharacterized protein YajQ (UPF0234 family)
VGFERNGGTTDFPGRREAGTNGKHLAAADPRRTPCAARSTAYIGADPIHPDRDHGKDGHLRHQLDRGPPGGRQRPQPGAQGDPPALRLQGLHGEIEFSKKDGTLTLLSDDEYKLQALVDVIQTKLIKRGVPVRNLDYGEVEEAFGGKARQTITLVQGISTEKGKEIVKAIKAAGFKKVNAQIQDEQVRVTSPSIDELQSVIAAQEAGLRIELSFGTSVMEHSATVHSAQCSHEREPNASWHWSPAPAPVHPAAPRAVLRRGPLQGRRLFRAVAAVVHVVVAGGHGHHHREAQQRLPSAWS